MHDAIDRAIAGAILFRALTSRMIRRKAVGVDAAVSVPGAEALAKAPDYEPYAGL